MSHLERGHQHQSDIQTGWLFGAIGMVIFGGSLVATRIGVADFDPIFFTVLRAVLAALYALVALLLFNKTKPQKADLFGLLIVAFGVVVGFPLLTAFALLQVTASHATVFIGLLPLSTALFGVLRTGDRPKRQFWIWAAIGSAIVVVFALLQGGSATLQGDLMMFVAIVICGLGYAEGARLAKHLGGWQVIGWALLLALPITLPLAFFTAPGSFDGVSIMAWSALFYVSMFSMFVGFLFWYRGLALGGVAAVGQLQLLQPFVGFILAALFVGEAISPFMIGSSGLIVLCVLAGKRAAR